MILKGRISLVEKKQVDKLEAKREELRQKTLKLSVFKKE